MREMKDSGIAWVGEIPQEWKIDKVKHIFRLRSSKGNIEPTLLAATQTHGMFPQNKLDSVVQVAEGTDLQNFKTVHINDFVISLRSFQGGFEMSGYEGVCSPAYQVFYNFVPIHHRYYKALFKSKSFIDYINSLTVGIREGKNIQYETFSYSFLPVPPLAEQERIADYLDIKCGEIDTLVSVVEQTIAELQAYKQSIITEAVTKGLNLNTPLKDRGWITYKMGQLVDIVAGVSYKIDDVCSGGIRILRGGNIQEGRIMLYSDDIFIKNTYYNVVNSVYKGDIVMVASTGSINALGKTGYCYEDMGKTQIGAFLRIIRAKTTMNAPFLNYMFLSGIIKKRIEKLSDGTNINNVRKEYITDFKIPVPPLSEQQEIADYLDKRCGDIDALISTKQQKIAELKEYKKSIIYEYVTGKKEII